MKITRNKKTTVIELSYGELRELQDALRDTELESTIADLILAAKTAEMEQSYST